MISYDDADISDRWASGQTVAAIARALGCHPATVKRALRRLPEAERAAGRTAGRAAPPPTEPELSDAEVLRRLTALVKRLEAEAKR